MHILRNWNALKRAADPVLRPAALAWLAVLLTGCAVQGPVSSVAPTPLPGIVRTMKSAGFWIARHPDPDRTIMDAATVIAFNNRLVGEQSVNDLFSLPPGLPGATVKTWLNDDVSPFTGGAWYLPDGRRADRDTLERLRATINTAALAETIPVRYGVTVRFADLRSLPTAEPLTATARETGLDELQNSDLDPGTPLAVVHRSADGSWLYVVEPLARGWVRRDAVAFCEKEALADFCARTPFVVVTAAKGDIFLNGRCTIFYDYARMGTRLPLLRETADTVEVTVPVRDKNGDAVFSSGYLDRTAVHAGYLSYTPRAMLTQAFRLLNAPYGWGGLDGEQDCSRFIHEVFSTAGIRLPRNSSAQRRAGVELCARDDRTTEETMRALLVERGVGGGTLLGMSGHIMLYLGAVDGKPFAIHALRAYREPAPRTDRIRFVNRVAVTDLSLGKGTSRGSLLDRLLTVRLVCFQ